MSVIICYEIYMFTIFVLKPILACIFRKGLRRAGLPADRVAQCPLAFSPSSDQYLNTARLFGTTACRRISQSQLRQSRDELSASFIPLQHLCPIGWHFTMLTFRLFPIDVTNCVVISFRNCAIHLVASTICCHQPVTPTSPPASEEHPYTLDLVIERTVTYHSSTVLF